MKRDGFGAAGILAFTAAVVATMLLCVCVGNVNIPLADTLDVLLRAVRELPPRADAAARILLYSRLPRVLCVALTGASLSLSAARPCRGF